jgi:hypothetical protein
MDVFPCGYTVDTGKGEYASDEEFELGLVEIDPGSELV